MTRTYPTYLPAAERRAATVESVVELAALRNPSEITTTAIADHMGLSQGALFKHFPTKDAILAAVMEWVAENLMKRVDSAMERGASPLIALEALFLAHAEFVSAHPGVPRIVFAELQRMKQSTPGRVVQALLRRYGERVAGILADARAHDELDPAIDIEAAAVLFVGTIQGLVMQSLLSGDVSRIRLDAPRVFAIYRRGIARAS
jgi:TetR/AcrR family transcriptional regulator